jgi:hypothetical protein
MKIAGSDRSQSVSQRYESEDADQDPNQNVTDPQHCYSRR